MKNIIQNFCSTVAIAAIFSFFTISVAKAGVVVYNDSFEGDAPSAQGPVFVGADVGTLLPGTNFIVAHSQRGDHDDYIFTIGPGTALVGINFNLHFSNIPILEFGADLYTSDGTLLSNQLHTRGIDIFEVGTHAFFGDALALGPGTYRIDNTNSGGPVSFVWPYRWDLIVESTSQVPEPASGLLVALALGLLGATRHRR